jgi:hypothetical protein
LILGEEVQTKDEVLVELMAEHITLKKSVGNFNLQLVVGLEWLGRNPAKTVARLSMTAFWRGIQNLNQQLQISSGLVKLVVAVMWEPVLQVEKMLHSTRCRRS